jgi:methylaspartate ammonia-lyase
VFFEAGAGDAAFFVDDQGARAAGAYVDAKNVNGRVSGG